MSKSKLDCLRWTVKKGARIHWRACHGKSRDKYFLENISIVLTSSRCSDVETGTNLSVGWNKRELKGISSDKLLTSRDWGAQIFIIDIVLSLYYDASEVVCVSNTKGPFSALVCHFDPQALNAFSKRKQKAMSSSQWKNWWHEEFLFLKKLFFLLALLGFCLMNGPLKSFFFFLLWHSRDSRVVEDWAGWWTKSCFACCN